MKTRKIGELTVSEVGMGCMAFSHGYGKIPDEGYSIEPYCITTYTYPCVFPYTETLNQVCIFICKVKAPCIANFPVYYKYFLV